MLIPLSRVQPAAPGTTMVADRSGPRPAEPTP
jgi:hypothetical protein